MENRKALLSTLWIFILFNMVYADILSLLDPLSPIRKIMEGGPVPSGGLTSGAIFMEIAIIMVILSRILNYKFNRIASSIAVSISTVLVVRGGHGCYYAIFASMEILAMIFILILSWRRDIYRT